MKLTAKAAKPVRVRRRTAERASPPGEREVPRETGRLDPSLESVLRAAAEWHSRIEAALATVGLSGAKFEALRHLAEAGEPLSLSELADRAQCVRSNITQLVDRLEADALVERVDDRSDRRMIRAQLTSLGRERYAAGGRLVDDVSAEFTAAMPSPDRTVLNRLLSRLH